MGVIRVGVPVEVDTYHVIARDNKPPATELNTVTRSCRIPGPSGVFDLTGDIPRCRPRLAVVFARHQPHRTRPVPSADLCLRDRPDVLAEGQPNRVRHPVVDGTRVSTCHARFGYDYPRI